MSLPKLDITDTMDAAELLEEFIGIAKDRGYLLQAGAKGAEWQAMTLLLNRLLTMRKHMALGSVGDAVNQARIALANAAGTCESAGDQARAHQLVVLMNVAQKLLPGEWLQEFDRQKLAEIRAKAS
jgi:hypothetical protein